MAVVMNPRKGYFGGVMSGITWGLDAVLLGVVMVMAPFVENPVLLTALKTHFICSQKCFQHTMVEK